MKCFLDLDGVLVNFVGGACRHHKMPTPYTRAASLGEWDVVKLLDVSPDQFWRGMGYDFWRLLDWMPDGRDILAVVESVFGADNVCLLTSPSDNFGAVEGKRAWVKNHLPSYFDRLIVGRCKDFMAGPERVLVDDYPVNVEKFSAAGGLGLLVPRPWNNQYELEAVATVRDSLKAVKE